MMLPKHTSERAIIKRITIEQFAKILESINEGVTLPFIANSLNMGENEFIHFIYEPAITNGFKAFA